MTLHHEVVNVTDPRWAGGMKLDGVTDDTDALIAAVHGLPRARTLGGTRVGSGILFFPPGVGCLSAVIPALPSGTRVKGSGRGSTILVQHGVGADMWSFTGDNASQFYTVFEDIGMVMLEAGGHIFNAAAAEFGHVNWRRCSFSQTNPGKSIFSMTDGSYIACELDKSDLTGQPNSTVAMWACRGRAIASNTWRRLVCTSSGYWFFELDTDAAVSPYCDGNHFADIDFEETNGGNIKIGSANGCTIEECDTYDLQVIGPTTNDLYILTRTGTQPPSIGNKLRRLYRRGGTLGAGLSDIHLIPAGGAGVNVIDQCNGQIDLGPTSGNTLLAVEGTPVPAANVINRTSDTAEISYQHVRSQSLGLWGATPPTAQPAAIAQVATTAPTQVTPFGFTTAGQFNDLIAAVNALLSAVGEGTGGYGLTG